MRLLRRIWPWAALCVVTVWTWYFAGVASSSEDSDSPRLVTLLVCALIFLWLVFGGVQFFLRRLSSVGRPGRGMAVGLGLWFAFTGFFAIETALAGYEYFFTPRHVIKRVPIQLHPRVERGTHWFGGELIFDVQYTFNEWGHRIVPGQEERSGDRQLLFIGCSFTFGAGVADDESLPSAVARRAPAWEVVNLGVGGHGTANVLHRLRNPTTLAPFDAPVQKLVYVFIPAHIYRSIGSMRIATQWGRRFPKYEMRDGDLVYVGPFNSVRPVRTAIYDVLAHEPFMRRFNIDWPPVLTGGDLRFTAQLIDASRTAFAMQTGSDDFTVVLYPTRKQREVAVAMKPYLEMLGIRCVDLTAAFDGQSDVFIEHDDHPSAKGHAIVAARLVDALDLEASASGEDSEENSGVVISSE